MVLEQSEVSEMEYEKEQLEELARIAASESGLGAFSGMIFNAAHEYPDVQTDDLIKIAVAIRLKVRGLGSKKIIEVDDETIPEEAPEVHEPSGPRAVPKLPAPKHREGGYAITCSICGAADHVPFEPKWKNALYCKDCFARRQQK